MKNSSVFFIYIKENKKNILCLIMVLLVGIILGIVFVNNANENQTQEIYSYVNSLKENIKVAESINRTIILKQSIKQNVLFVLTIWFLGCTLLGSFFIYVTIIYKGFSIGYTASSIIAALGTKSRNIICNSINVATKLDFFTNDFNFIKQTELLYIKI